jgi:hypothetical protein
MTTYRLLREPLSGEVCAVFRNDGYTIPFDPANTDYAEYLKWLDAGNEPLPSDEQNGQNTPST